MGGIISTKIEKEMEESYLDYAMSVIVARALPDVRDGLKPVQRRILWAMWEDGLKPEAKFKKSASVVGTTLARYHPHGDTAVYDALARMVQDFSLRYPLIEGQGNWGSIDGDSQAAMRYTEAKLSKIAVPLLEDIEKETVDWGDNYDRSRKEPKVLPAGLPNLLINGSMGIAVGMATNIPPHNLNEIIDGLVYLIDHPDASLDELLKFIKGPDFPTGGILFADSGLKEAYQTGRGGVILRAKCEIEETSKKTAIIVKEIPYQVNKAELIKKIAQLVETKKIEGIKTIRDESDKEGIRVVIELKSNVSPKKVLNCLYQYSDLQRAYHFNMVALVDGIQPQLLSLKDFLTYYLDHRKEVVTRRSQYLLKRTQERIHILEGLFKALKNIDKVISLIKKSKNYQEAKEKLQKFLKITEIQAKAILEIKLQNLVKLEKEKIEKELSEKRKFEKYLKEILSSSKKIFEVIKKELLEIKEKFADERRTKIETRKIKEFKEEDLIQKEPTIIFFSNQNYIKRVSPLISKVQRRGGKGIIGFQRKDDFLKLVLFAQTTDDLFFFTDKGKVYQLKVYQIPESSRTSSGKSIFNFLEISKDEKIFSIKSFSNESKKPYLIFATKNGFAKKTKIEEFSNIRKNGILAIKLQKDDALVGVDFCEKNDEIFLSSSLGNSILFKEKDLRKMGRVASGVLAMKLKENDKIVSFLSIEKEEKNAKLLVVSEKGYGKLVRIKDFRLQKRAGKGIRLAKISEKTGEISFVLKVKDLEKDLLLISQKGLMLKTTLKGIPTLSRNASGVKLMRVEKDDKIIGGSLL